MEIKFERKKRLKARRFLKDVCASKWSTLHARKLNQWVMSTKLIAMYFFLLFSFHFSIQSFLFGCWKLPFENLNMSFKSSVTLKTLEASKTKSVTFATASRDNPTESLPAEERWWSSKFHLGPRSIIKSSKNYNKSTSATSVTFTTVADGSSIISHVSFAPNAIKGSPYQLAVAAGPRVCLYGGSQGSSLAKALARPGTKKIDVSESLFGTIEDESKVKADRTVSTGGFPSHHAAYHSDGRLLAVGCDDGYIKVCDARSRATLRTFSTNGSGRNNKGGHPIRSVGWLPDKGTSKGSRKLIWSAGDDAILRIWDLAGTVSGVGDEGKPIVTIRSHGDTIRTCAAVSISGDGKNGKKVDKTLLVTGSYDHTIRAWDLDGLQKNEIVEEDEAAGWCSSVMDHGAPVETIIVLRQKNGVNSPNRHPIIASAGGTTIKLWNPLLGTCLSTIQTKHSKTITSLCLASIIRGDNDEEDIKEGYGKKKIVHRLLSAGLDGLIRIYSVDELLDDKRKETGPLKLPYVHGSKTPYPITSIAISRDSTKFVVGTSTGFVTVYQRAKYVPQGVKRKSPHTPRGGTYSFFMRGASLQADADDHIVIIQKKKKLQKYDTMLKQFRYSDALDEALRSRDPKAVRYSSLNVILNQSIRLRVIDTLFHPI
jgi:U3 small nucleolar RNA-associated protein 15